MNSSLSPTVRWLRLLVLPLQVYVPTAWLLLKMYTEYAARHRDAAVNELVLYGYGLSFLALCVAAFLQRKYGDRIGSTFSLLMAIAAVPLATICLPVLSR